MFRACSIAVAIGLPFVAQAQLVVWAEEFENGCASGCLASSYVGVNGAWTIVSTGTNGTCPNNWFISCAENGNVVGACGTGCGTNESLHVGNSGTCASPNGCFFCPAGDCGAAYDASCPAGICFVCCSCNSSVTDRRATSPVIDLTGQSTVTLSFKYMEGGQGSTDNASVWYFDGAIWSLLADMPKTATTCAGGQGLWTAFGVALPASANNNPAVRVGFRWVNDDDGAGADPSVAIDEVQLSIPYAPVGTGLIVNELSNGPSGNKEYIELLAVGPNCSTIDARLIKVDDNNGVAHNGFGNTMANSGAAPGHLRFSNAAQWATVPTGSLILIYNELDRNALIPPDDPSDLAPHDSIYVLPANSPLMQGCGTLPDAIISSGYNPCVFGAGVWNYIGMRNPGDAGQTRDANGRYFHGISYGTNGQNMNNGGLDNLRISAMDHTGRVLYFNSGNFRLAANFGSALVAGNETPAAVNNPANAIYRKTFLCLTLPVGLLSFEAMAMGDRVRLVWRTATETDNAWFTVERSVDGTHFSAIGTVPGAGDSQQERQYIFDDAYPIPGIGYYRLRQTDFDGTSSLSNVVAEAMGAVAGQPLTILHQNGELVVMHGFPLGATMDILDVTGRMVRRGRVTSEGLCPVQAEDLPHGTYVLRLDAGDRSEAVRFGR